MKNNISAAKEGSIVAINKPAGWTSFDVVNKVRRMTGIKKVGHAGTLDPFATGVLIVCMGLATKKSAALMHLQKEYIAEITLGSETDTMDGTGTVICKSPLPSLALDRVKTVLNSFIGSIEQEIPAYSAAKFKGRRLYKMARQGKEIPRLLKKVDIYDVQLIDWANDSLKIKVVCGRGTYIRTLARDIARRLDTRGHVKSLIRTRVGDYKLENALTIEELQSQLKTVEASNE